MQITHFEQDNMRYSFEPPVEAGDQLVSNIHELAAIALVGSEAPEDAIVSAMHGFTATLRSEKIGYDRVAALNEFLDGVHVVTGGEIKPGMPAWRSSTPFRGKVPGAELEPARQAQIQRDLFELSCAEALAPVPAWADQLFPVTTGSRSSQ